MKILYDAIDIAMLRIKPLPEYQYPQWQVLTLLAALSLALAPTLVGLHTDLLSRAVFVFAFKLAIYASTAWFLRIWLRLPLGAEKRPLTSWNGEGSLFTLLVMVQCIDFLQPLLLWVPPGMRLLLGFTLLVYSCIVLLRALTTSTGVPTHYMVGGLFLYLPVMFAIAMVFGGLALGWGWVDLKELLPPDVAAAMETGASGAAVSR